MFLGFPGKSTGGPIWGFSRRANFPHGLAVVLRLRSVSVFTSGRFQRRSYSASAATLKEEAVKATFSSPSASSERFRQRLIRSTYRPSDSVGLHRSCSTQDLSSSGGCMLHPRGSPLLTASAAERGHWGVPYASSKGGDWRPTQAEMPSPEVSLPGPFATVPSPDPPVEPPWLRTLAETCKVRARSSVRARTRTGRLWRVCCTLLSSPYRLFIGRLSPEPLRLTRPERAKQRPIRCTVTTLLHPFRAAVVFGSPRPRALPWAVMLRPFGANQNDAVML